MSVMSTLGRYVFMQHLRSIFLIPNPFKIYEFKHIFSRVGTNKDGLLIDIGCGRGLQTVLIARKFRKTFGIDINPQIIEIAQTKLRRSENQRVFFKNSDLIVMQFGNDSVDVIVSFSVLEHISDWQQVLAESLRILKPGGRMLFSVDSLESINNAELLEKHKRDFKVAQYFSVEQLREVLKDTGFRNISIRNIFKSQFARRLFGRGIKSGFSYNRFLAPFLYIALARFERIVEHQSIPGIFIVAEANK